jgi:hypothetical protein
MEKVAGSLCTRPSSNLSVAMEHCFEQNGPSLLPELATVLIVFFTR